MLPPACRHRIPPYPHPTTPLPGNQAHTMQLKELLEYASHELEPKASSRGQAGG